MKKESEFSEKFFFRYFYIRVKIRSFFRQLSATYDQYLKEYPLHAADPFGSRSDLLW